LIIILNDQHYSRRGLSPVHLSSFSRAKLSGNELDLALIASTNDENWQAAPALLHAISSAAYSQFSSNYVVRSGRELEISSGRNLERAVDGKRFLKYFLSYAGSQRRGIYLKKWADVCSRLT